MKYSGGSLLNGGFGDSLRVILTLHAVAGAADVSETAARAIISTITSAAAASAAAGPSSTASCAVDEVTTVLILAIQGRVSFAKSSSAASSSKEQQKENAAVKKVDDADADDGDGGEGAATLLATADDAADHIVTLPSSSRAFASRVFCDALRLWWAGDSQHSLLRSTTSFVSAAYSAATSDDAGLRVEGLNLLAALITVFGAQADPDAAGCFILEQCAAQIMSAMRSCLSNDTPACVRSFAALTLGSWMDCPACNRTPGAVSRCMKILQGALSSCDDASSCSSSTDDEASCRLALVAALARGIQADSAASISSSTGAVESSATGERGSEYQDLANVFDAQLLQLLKATHSSGDSKSALTLAPPLLSAACAHAVASQSRSRAGLALAMWVAAATAAPCAGLLLGGGLQNLFAAFPAADEGDNSSDGLSCKLIRAAIVCAAVIVEVCWFPPHVFCLKPIILTIVFFSQSAEAADVLPLCTALCQCSRSLILNSPGCVDSGTALIMLRNLLRLLHPLKSQPEASADTPIMKSACTALELAPQFLLLAASSSAEAISERQAVLFLMFSAVCLGREEPVHIAAARSFAALASNAAVWDSSAVGSSLNLREFLGAAAWSLANTLSSSQLSEGNRNASTSVLLVLLCRWCSSGMHRDIAAFSRAFLSFCAFVAGAACSLPLPPTLAACSKLLSASSSILPIAPETRSLVSAMCTLCSFTVHSPSATAATAEASLAAFKSIVSALLDMGQTTAAEVRSLPCLFESNTGVIALKPCFLSLL
jgi:hypothetical protein